MTKHCPWRVGPCSVCISDRMELVEIHTVLVWCRGRFVLLPVVSVDLLVQQRASNIENMYVSSNNSRHWSIRWNAYASLTETAFSFLKCPQNRSDPSFFGGNSICNEIFNFAGSITLMLSTLSIYLFLQFECFQSSTARGRVDGICLVRSVKCYVFSC